MPAVIDVENLSKKYVIKHRNRPAYATLRETLADQGRIILNRLLGKPPGENEEVSEEFWALKDVSFKIEEGDRIGIIGRNGAGKSTLLKILSRITEPTNGRITVRGRVASLLEVGMGFHPELTGRENIFLNGAILGMTRKELKRKFDEIVAFAEIEQFLDTPIKRYSSGMSARLGFGVAAHLDPDLLIVDEALAVGDVQFQEKCLNKMGEIGASGRTIIFVSHSMSSMLTLCNKGLFLEKGRVVAYESIDACVTRYLNKHAKGSGNWKGNIGDEHIRIREASLSAPGAGKGFYYQGEEARLEIDVEVLKPREDVILGFSICDSRNQLLARSRLCDVEEHLHVSSKKGMQRAVFLLDMNLFHPGEYLIKLDCSLYNQKRIVHDEISLKFCVYARDKPIKMDIGMEKEGISLGNRWLLHGLGSENKEYINNSAGQ